MKSSIQRDKKREWSAQENSLLKQLYPNFSSKKWKKISQIFKQKGYDRSELQIRERWTNFQDPNLLFTQWTDQQLETLYRSYTKFGSKWCFIKRTIPGRTQNKIKNKFYGNIRIFLRFVVNYFNSTKQDTMWIHKINPSILNDIYRGSDEFSQFGNEMEVAIEEMGYNVDKIKLLSRIQTKQAKYKAFYDKVILLYKSIEQKKQNSPRKNKRQNLQLSEIDYAVSPLQNQQDQENEISPEEKQEKKEVPGVGFPSFNEGVSISNYENGFNSLTLTKQNYDSSNYPLMHLQNMYPYYNCWFYPNSGL